jgi:hypothetical protein
VENFVTPVAPIQGMVQSASFIRSWWLWHLKGGSKPGTRNR